MPGDLYFIINENDVDIGCFFFGLSRDSDNDEYTGELALGENENKGYGSKGLHFVDTISKAKGYTKITLWVLQKIKLPFVFMKSMDIPLKELLGQLI